MPDLELVCLAKSWRNGGWCVAGKTTDDRTWVRPVSAREHEEVPESDQRYDDGRECSLLDIVELVVERPVPHRHQLENWLYSSNSKWRSPRKLKAGQLPRFVDHPSELWEPGYESQGRLNDRIPEASASGISNSLYLIAVDRLVVRDVEVAGAPGQFKIITVAEFVYNDREYILKLTDPKLVAEFKEHQSAMYDFGQCYVTVSLTLPFHRHLHKLVAGVMRA